MYKICPTCKQSKSLDCYYKNKARANGVQSECKDCTNKRERSNRPKNRTQKALQKRNTNLKRFGISKSLDELAKEQNNQCAICKKITKLHIDHDHITNQYRGLLCFQCNTALGKFEDSIERLNVAIQYLATMRK